MLSVPYVSQFYLFSRSIVPLCIYLTVAAHRRSHLRSLQKCPPRHPTETKTSRRSLALTIHLRPESPSRNRIQDPRNRPRPRNKIRTRHRRLTARLLHPLPTTTHSRRLHNTLHRRIKNPLLPIHLRNLRENTRLNNRPLPPATISTPIHPPPMPRRNTNIHLHTTPIPKHPNIRPAIPSRPAEILPSKRRSPPNLPTQQENIPRRPEAPCGRHDRPRNIIQQLPRLLRASPPGRRATDPSTDGNRARIRESKKDRLCHD